MKDKHTYDLIEGIGDLDKLDFDFDKITKELDEKFNIDDKDIEKIKARTYEKIGKSKLKKYKNKKIISLVASIALLLMIGTPVALAIVDQLYKYDSSSGKIIKSEKPVYILKQPITKEAGKGKITINSFIANPSKKELEMYEVAENLSEFDYVKTEIKVNGKDINNDVFIEAESGWKQHNISPYEYKIGDKIVYSVILKDKENKITNVDFDIDLVEATSVEKYNHSIPKYTNNDITVSAITKEEENNLYVELMAIPNKEAMDFEIDNYGKDADEGRGTDIFLIDANNEEIEAEYVDEGNGINKFKFNIENLRKPFALEVKTLKVYNANIKGTKVKLPKLKLNEEKEINKIIDVEDKNSDLTKESHKVLIKSVGRYESDDSESYKIDIDFPDNKNSNIKIKQIGIELKSSIFRPSKNTISSMGMMSSEDGIYRDIYLSIENNTEKDKKSNKGRSLELEIAPTNFVIEGLWKLEIK